MWKTLAPVLVVLAVLPPAPARAIMPGGCVIEAVYRVTVEDGLGNRRRGWVRCGG